jgi:hypothetical protein
MEDISATIDKKTEPELERELGAADEETEDEEVKMNCVGGVRGYGDSDCWDSVEEDEEEPDEEDEER